MSRKQKLGLTVAMTAILAFTLGSTAVAHVGTEPSEVPVGSSSTIEFRIGHGCDGSATTSVSLQIPAGVASVRPFPKPGWDLDIESGVLPEPIATDGEPITEGVTVVTWSGGLLEDAHTDVFAIRATVYGAADDMVWFPLVQTCESGEHAWIEIPEVGQDDHELDSPAPVVTLIEAGDDDHAHTDASNSDTDGDAAGANEEEPASSSNTLAIIALGVGFLGIVVGGLALARSRSN